MALGRAKGRVDGAVTLGTAEAGVVFGHGGKSAEAQLEEKGGEGERARVAGRHVRKRARGVGDADAAAVRGTRSVREHVAREEDAAQAADERGVGVDLLGELGKGYAGGVVRRDRVEDTPFHEEADRGELADRRRVANPLFVWQGRCAEDLSSKRETLALSLSL